MHELNKALGGFNTSNNNDNTQPRAELHQSIAKAVRIKKILTFRKNKNLQTRGFVEKFAQLCNKHSFSQESSDSRDTHKPAQQKFSEHNDKSVEGKLLLTIFVHADSDFWTHPSHVGASVDICVSTPSLNFSKKMTSC